MSTLISVIVPAYNAQATLRRAVGSACQSRSSARPIEIVIVNDGSTDDTPRIAEGLARDYPDVHVVHQPNSGLSAARGAGLRVSTGDRVLFLDADDELSPVGLGALEAALDDPGVGAAVGGFVVRDDRGLVIAHHAPPADLSLNGLLSLPLLIVPAVMLRREVALAYPFDPSRRRVEDYDLWFRLALGGVRLRPVRAEVCAYEVRPGTMSTDFEAMLGHGSHVVSAAFERASGVPSVDASPARRDRVLGSLAHAWAARAATLGQTDRARRLLQAAPQGYVLTPDVAAGHAVSAVRLGLARRVEFPPDAPSWVRPLCDWWDALGSSGLTDGAQFARRVLRAMPERALDPASVANQILDQLPLNTRSIVIRGHGANAAVLEREAASRGVLKATSGGLVVQTDSPAPGPADLDWYRVRAGMALTEANRAARWVREVSCAQERDAIGR